MQVPELQRHYGEWEITGSPEVRHVAAATVQPFNTFSHKRQCNRSKVKAKRLSPRTFVVKIGGSKYSHSFNCFRSVWIARTGSPEVGSLAGLPD
jgi:hypothetical protein